MGEDEAGAGVEEEEGIGEGVVMAIKVVMEIIKVDMDTTRGGMQIIKVLSSLFTLSCNALVVHIIFGGLYTFLFDYAFHLL